MDERILVAVYVPIVQLRFDMYLPLQAVLRECMEACREYIEKKRCYHQEDIYLYHDNQLLSLDQSVKDSGLHTGSDIILL